MLAKPCVSILLLTTYTAVQAGFNAICPSPENISNGHREYEGTRDGNTVFYSCRAGYVMANGTAERTCDFNGLWNGTLPVCEDIDIYFKFTCDVNGTVTAVNPDPTSLIWAQANNEDGTCTSVFSGDNSTVTITGCDIEKGIALVFSPLASGIPLVLMDNVKYYNITCNKIPHDGIMIVVTDDTWVRNVVATTREPNKVPKIIVNSAIGVQSDIAVSNETTTPSGDTTVTTPAIPTVVINQPLRWILYGPETYNIEPINCIAYSGAIDENGSKFSLLIAENGCSLDSSLLTHFNYLVPDQKHQLYADLYAFRFPGSYEVEIVCFMKGCPPGSTACDFNCDRKRRSAHDIESGSEDSRLARDNTATKGESPVNSARIFFRVNGPANVGLEYLSRSSAGSSVGSSVGSSRQPGTYHCATVMLTLCAAIMAYH